MKAKFLGKKGQGAMEYLMTYGWAILVVMIVGVVLWQLGIFSNQGQANKCNGFVGTKIGCLDASIKCTTGYVNATLTNQAGVALSSIVVTPAGGAYDDTVTGLGAEITTLGPGGKSTVAIAPTTATTVGDSITTIIDITFTERVAGESITRTINDAQLMCTVES